MEVVLPSDVIAYLEKMETAMRNLKSVQYTSHLTFTAKGKKITKTEQSTAKIWMQKPLFFRIDASQDGKNTLLFVCDNKQLFLYEYKTNRYGVFEPTPQRVEKATGFSLLSFVLTPNLKERLLVGVVSASLTSHPSYLLLTLQTKDRDSFQIYMDKKTFLPFKTRIDMQFASLEEAVSELKLDPKIPPSTFTFEPPKGAMMTGFRL